MLDAIVSAIDCETLLRIKLLGTGGTIASRATAGGRAAVVDVAELYERAAGGRWTGVEVDCKDIALRPSAALDFHDLALLGTEVANALESGSDAVVITHGTDALEETAFVLALLHSGPQPVVLTGAQRPFDDPSPDGPRNLSHALEWAAHDAARGTGVTATFDGAILPAVGLRKVDTLVTSAFAAPGRGLLGRAGEAGIRASAAPTRTPALLKPEDLTQLPDVAVVPLYLGCGTGALEVAADHGARGIVLAAFGAGNATPEIVAMVSELVADGVAVAVSTRVPSGPVAPLYAGGGGADLERAGAMFTGDLSPWQSRWLLAAALARTSRSDQVGSILREWTAS